MTANPTLTVLWGSTVPSIAVDAATGAVLSTHREEGSHAEAFEIIRFDLAEYRAFWANRHPECLDAGHIDILDVGFWHLRDGMEVYEPAEAHFRYGWITEEVEEAARTAGHDAYTPQRQEDVERAVGVELEAMVFDPEDWWSACHEEDEVTHFSVYIRVPDDKNNFLLARHVVDVARAEGSAPAVECAKRIATLLQVPFTDNRTVLKEV